MTKKEYIRNSLELNLFFLRIAKEHAVFAASSLPLMDTMVMQQLIAIKNNFEVLLSKTVNLADGLIGRDVIDSEELVTEFTLAAELRTQFLTGISINTSITKREHAFIDGELDFNSDDMAVNVSKINRRATRLISDAIDFIEMMLDEVLNCESFSFTYPTMLEHVLEESRFYLKQLERLQDQDNIEELDFMQEFIEQEMLWNDVMYEHATFIRGYLDPSEEVLINAANDFSKELKKLHETTDTLPTYPELLPEITMQSKELVKRLKIFKKQGTEGILECEIRSVILPLLSDHVTREANHYLRILRKFDKTK